MANKKKNNNNKEKLTEEQNGKNSKDKVDREQLQANKNAYEALINLEEDGQTKEQGSNENKQKQTIQKRKSANNGWTHLLVNKSTNKVEQRTRSIIKQTWWR